MSFFGGGGGFNNHFGRGGGFRPPQHQQHNQNMRFGILPLMRPNQHMPPNQHMQPRFGGNQRGGGRPQFRRGIIFKAQYFFIVLFKCYIKVSIIVYNI